MRLAVYGVGGAGGFFGAQLIRAGHPVSFVARGAHLEAIQESGLQIRQDDGEFSVSPVAATDDATELEPVDVVILGVKAHQVASLKEPLTHLLAGSQSFVLPLQNGVETAGVLSGIVGSEHVVGGLCGTVSWVESPGTIRSLGNANFIRFGELDNHRSDRAEALRQLFQDAGIAAEIPENIQTALWEKFLFVVSVGGVAALHDMTVGELRDNTETRQLLETAMGEIFELAECRGVQLADDLVERTLSFVDTLPADGTASMQRDIAANRPSELDAWNGAVVRLATAAGLDVPAHQKIYAALIDKMQVRP